MKNINIVLFEDDPLDKIKIELMIAENNSLNYNLNLIGIFDDITELTDFLSKNEVNLIISDIYIKQEKLGLKLCKIIDFSQTILILMTLSKEKELFDEASKYAKIHYLIKPFHSFTLHSAIELALSYHEFINNATLSNQKQLNLSVKQGQKERVTSNHILYIKSENTHTFFFSDTKKYVLKKSLTKVLLEDLDSGFLRIHHRYAVNVKCIKSWKIDSLILINNEQLPIGRTYQKSVCYTLTKTQ